MDFPIEKAALLSKDLRETFDSGKTKPLEFRLSQLKKLYWAIEDNSDRIADAIWQDLRRPKGETTLFELSFLKNELIYIIENLKSWAKPDSLAVGFPLNFSNFKRQKLPLGEILIIAPWNFPLILSMSLLAGAIAAGNTAICKMSELAPASARVIADIVNSALDTSCYRVTTGDHRLAQAFLEQKFDKICFTGGERVAKIISLAAAKTLTPVLLELGGKNPAIVTRSADIEIAARRVIWGKTANAGQICLAPDYVLVEREVRDEFIEACKRAIKKFFPKGTQSDGFGRIVNETHVDRLRTLINDAKGTVAYGGSVDIEDRYVEPTLIKNVTIDDVVMQSEIFGPILPIIDIESLDEAVRFVNDNFSEPLALYVHCRVKDQTQFLLNNICSGGATVNDSFIHSVSPIVPFGGVGSSGTGSYRGKYSFEALSHFRTIAENKVWLEKLWLLRYPPLSSKKLKKLTGKLDAKPSFNRDGTDRFRFKKIHVLAISLIVGLIGIITSISRG